MKNGSANIISAKQCTRARILGNAKGAIDGELPLPETDLILGWSYDRYFLERFKASKVCDETNVGTNDFTHSHGGICC